MWADTVTTSTVADGIAARADFRQPFLIRTADCLPLTLITDEVACALHVSRKSLVAGLLDAVDTFIDVKKIRQIHIGPHICAEHFVFEHIGDEVGQFAVRFPSACQTSTTGLHLSLMTVVNEYFRKWKIYDHASIRDDRCTLETLELPSYRRSRREGTSLDDHVATIVWSA